MRMPFGRYRGELVTDIPDGYLEWLRSLDDLREPLREAVELEWEARSVAAEMPATVRAAGNAIVAVGYRTLATRHHPDHAGDTVLMQNLNGAAAWLRRQLRSLSA
jgi:putative quorum-sensing-regulated virulence factor